MAMQKLLLLAFMFMACTVVVIYSRPMIDTSDIVKDIRDIENILNESDTDTSDDDDEEETKDSDDADDDKDDDKSDTASSESSDAAPKDKNSEDAPTIKDVSNATDVDNTTDGSTDASAEPSNTTSANNTTATAAPAADNSAADTGKSDTSRKDHIGIGQRLTSEQKDDPDPETPSAPNEFAKINPPESETTAAASPAPATSAVKDAKEAPLSKTETSKEGAHLADATTKQSKEEVRVSEKAPTTEDKTLGGSTNDLKETSTQASPQVSPKEEESSEEGKSQKKDEEEVPDKPSDNAVANKTVDAEENDEEDDEEGESLTKSKPETAENSETSPDEETVDARTAAQTEAKSDDVEGVERENEDDRVKMFFISPYEREEAAPEAPVGAERPTVRQILTYPATNGHGWGHSHQWGPSHIWNSDYPYYAYGYSWGCGGHGDNNNNHDAMKKSNVKAKVSGKDKSESKSDKKTKVKGKSGKKGKKSETNKKTDWICRDYMLVPATPRGPLMDPSVVDIERGSARQNVYSKDVACNEEDQQCKQRQVIGSMAGGSLFGDGMGGLGMGFPGVPGIHAGLSGYNEMGGFGDHEHGGCQGGHCGGGAGFGGGYGGPVNHFFGERNFWGERQHIPQYLGHMYGLENSVKKSSSPKKNPYDYNANVGNGGLGYGNYLSGFNNRPLYNEGFGEPVSNAAENQNFFGTQGWGNAGGTFVRQQGNEFGNWAPNVPENGGNFMGPYGAGNGVENVNNNGVDSYFGGKELPPGTPYIGNGNDYGVGRTVHSVMNAEAQGKLGLTGKISINGIHKNFSYKSKIRKHKDKKEKPATTRQDIAMPDEQAMMEITKQRQLIGSLGASTLFADNVGGMGLGHPGVPQMSSGISGIPGEYGGTGGYSHGWNGEDQPGINPHGFRHYAYGNRGLDRGEQDHGSVYQPQHSVTDSGHRRTQILAADPEYNSRVSQQLVEAAQASQMTPQKMSEIERMVHDVSDSIDRTNRKLMAITANNGKRQITPAFTPVVSEPAAVPDIRYPVPAADRYPLGAGYIWPSANYGHQLGGPFAWSKSSTPTAEKTSEKPKTEKKTTKSKLEKKDAKSKVVNKKHTKKAIKDHNTHVKKERRSVEKSNSTGSEKTGTKRQFLAHPYERSSEGYPYHGGMPIYGSGMGFPMSHGAGFTGHAGSQRAFARHFHSMGDGGGYGGGGGGGYQQGGFHGGFGHRLRASHSFLPTLSGRYNSFANHEAGGGYGGGGMPMGMHHQSMYNGGGAVVGGGGGGGYDGGLHGMMGGHDAGGLMGGHDSGELMSDHNGGAILSAHDAGGAIMSSHDGGAMMGGHDVGGQGYALGGHGGEGGFGSLSGVGGGSLGGFSHSMGGGMIEDHQGGVPEGSQQLPHGFGHAMQFAMPQEESHSGYISRHGGGGGGYGGTIGGPVPGGFESGGGGLPAGLGALGAGVSGLVSGGSLSGGLDQGFPPGASHSVDGGYLGGGGGGGEHLAGFGRQSLDPQQSEQATGDPSSFAPMLHNQMPQGLMPQMVPEPQPGMFSPNPLTPYGTDIRGMDYPMTSKRASVPKHRAEKEHKRKADQWD